MNSQIYSGLVTAVGGDVGGRIYANVIPVQTDFPCVMFERVFTDHFHSKTIATASKIRFRITIFVKDSVGTDSARALCDSYSDAIKTHFHTTLTTGNTTEYRFENIEDDYNEEVEVFLRKMDLEVFTSDYE